MPSAYLQWRFHSGERVVARGPLVFCFFFCRGRLQKGRLFVFQNAENQAIHLVPPSCHEEGLFVNQTEPLKAQGGYLQVTV